MIKLIVASAFSLILACGALAAANDIVEVRMVETATPLQPTTKPAADAAREVPKNAKVLLSIEALADSGGDAQAKCSIGDDTTIILEGHLKVSTDGMRRLEITFSRRNSQGSHEVRGANVVLGLNDPKVIGGLTTAKFSYLIVATVKPNAKTPRAKAE
jgi:hypothetical protein